MQTFPHGQAIVALHRNTAQLHMHMWIAARETTGRKINLSARVFHSLDESWGRIYAHAFGRDPEEQRLRKEETRRHWREPHLYPRPERSRPHWKTTIPLEINQRDANEKERQPYAAQENGIGSMGITKQALEEANADLEDRLLQSKAENSRLERENQALRETLHQSESLLAQQSEQYEKLTDYVTRLYAWAKRKGKSEV